MNIINLNYVKSLVIFLVYKKLYKINSSAEEEVTAIEMKYIVMKIKNINGKSLFFKKCFSFAKVEFDYDKILCNSNASNSITEF